MICFSGPFIGAWEHPTMPLTKREAEIRNKPLRSEAGAPPIWNHVQDKIDQSVVFTLPSGPGHAISGPVEETAHLSSRVITLGNGASTWEADLP